MTVIGVDVSRYQGADWKPREQDKYVVIKCTEGRTIVSPTLAAQDKTARDAGLLIGYYHYLHPGNATEQAAYFVKNLPANSESATLWCDWEGDWSAGKHPSVEDAAEFIAAVKAARPRNRVGLYCNASDWKSTAVKAGDGLWIAHYTDAAQPDIRQEWDLWQYTDKPIDQNRSAVETLDELRAWWSLEHPDPEPVPGPVEPEPEPLPPPDPVMALINTLTAKTSTTPKTTYVVYQGENILQLDLEIILRCAAAVGWGPVKLIQGGLSKGSLSAKTHEWFGGYDLRTWIGRPGGHTLEKTWEFSAALTRSGIVGFIRGVADSFDDHLHLASREAGKLAHQQLRDQITEFLDGGDGLRGSKEYYGPDVRLGTWATSPYNIANITADSGHYTVTTDGGQLLGLDVDRKIVTRAPNGYPIIAAKRVQRWDRSNVVDAGEVYWAAEYLTPKETNV